MKHHYHCPDFPFVYNPVEFNKYSDKEFLQYCPGAVMYMPGTRNFSPKILEKSVLGLTTLVLCLEDACPEQDVPAAEENVLQLLDTVSNAIENTSPPLGPKFSTKQSTLVCCSLYPARVTPK
jgi:hypothetical protein